MSVKVINPTNNDLQNIKTLNERNRGDVYYSDKGLLKKMSFIQKIFLKLSKFFSTAFYKTNQNDVKNIINGVVSRIESADEDFLTSLFFKHLTPISEKIFDRSKINKKVQAVLRKSITTGEDFQKIEQKIRNNHSYFSMFSRNVALENARKFRGILLEAKLATNLGVRAVKAQKSFYFIPGSFSKFYLIRDINHQFLGIFKPGMCDSLSMQAPFYPMRLRNKFLSKLGFGGSLFKHLAGKCHVAEWASFEMDEAIGTNIVPPTAVIQLDPIQWKRKKTSQIAGSLQIFVKGVREAREFLDVHKTYEKVSRKFPKPKKELSDELFDKMVIMDVLSGNLDRHSENWLIQVDPKDPNRAKDIVLIDGGMAFSPTHASSSLELGKQYVWAKTTFEWARRKFTSQAKEIIKDVYNRRFHLRQKLIKIYVSHGDKKKYAIQRADRMVERIEMLNYVAITKDMKKYRLIDFRTRKEMQRAAQLIQAGA